MSENKILALTCYTIIILLLLSSSYILYKNNLVFEHNKNNLTLNDINIQSSNFDKLKLVEPYTTGVLIAGDIGNDTILQSYDQSNQLQWEIELNVSGEFEITVYEDIIIIDNSVLYSNTNNVWQISYSMYTLNGNYIDTIAIKTGEFSDIVGYITTFNPFNIEIIGYENTIWIIETVSPKAVGNRVSKGNVTVYEYSIQYKLFVQSYVTLSETDLFLLQTQNSISFNDHSDLLSTYLLNLTDSIIYLLEISPLQKTASLTPLKYLDSKFWVDFHQINPTNDNLEFLMIHFNPQNRSMNLVSTTDDTFISNFYPSSYHYMEFYLTGFGHSVFVVFNSSLTQLNFISHEDYNIQSTNTTTRGQKGLISYQYSESKILIVSSNNEDTEVFLQLYQLETQNDLEYKFKSDFFFLLPLTTTLIVYVIYRKLNRKWLRKYSQTYPNK